MNSADTFDTKMMMKKRVQGSVTGWMVADFYPDALRSYNEIVDDCNRLCCVTVH